MQVPVSTKAVSGGSAVVSSAGSAFSKTGEAGAAKRGLLPAFVEILTEQTGGSGIVQRLGNAVGDLGDPEKTADENSHQLVNRAATSYLRRLLPAQMGEIAKGELQADHSSEKATQPAPGGDKKSKTGVIATSTTKPATSSRASDSSTTTFESPAFFSAAVVTPNPTEQPISQGRFLLSPTKSVARFDVPRIPMQPLSSVDQKDRLIGDPRTLAALDSKPAEAKSTVITAAHPFTTDMDLRRTQAPVMSEAVTALLQEKMHGQSLSSQQSTSPLTAGDAPDGHPGGQAEGPANHTLVAGADEHAMAHHATALHALEEKPKTQQRLEPGAGRSATTPVATIGSPNTIGSQMSAPVAGGSAIVNSSQHPARGKDAAPVTDSTFQRLDSGEAPATLLHASAREVAVGVRDPSLGWVEIQTQSSGGHVSASLTAASAEAHASLTIAAPAISQYLQDRNVHIHNLDVSMQSGPESGGRQQSNSGGAEQEVSRQVRTSSPQSTQPMRKTADDPGALEAGRLSRISVRA